MTIGDGEPRTATSTFTQLLSSDTCCVFEFSVALTPTETIRTIRDGKPRTATSTFTQFLGSVPLSSSVLRCVHRDRRNY